MLKTCYRQYQQYAKIQTMLKNNLIFLRYTIWLAAVLILKCTAA